MNELNINVLNDFVNENIINFHNRRIKSLEGLSLNKLLKKNPYLLKAKNLVIASDLISNLMEAFLSSSEEQIFGSFLEDLAIHISGITCGGHKSTAPGVDLEFINNGTHYVVSIKSGTNWGNSSQIANPTTTHNAVSPMPLVFVSDERHKPDSFSSVSMRQAQ